MTPNGDEHDQVAAGERRPGRACRDGQRGGQRHPAPEPGPARSGAAAARPAGAAAAAGAGRAPGSGRASCTPRPAGCRSPRATSSAASAAPAGDVDIRPSTAPRSCSPTSTNRRAVEQERGQLPERARLQPGAGRRSIRGPIWLSARPAHHDGEHPGGVHLLREQERRERGEHADAVLEQRVVDAAAGPAIASQRQRQPGRGAAHVGQREAPASAAGQRTAPPGGHRRPPRANSTSAVPSLIRLSARSVVSVRRGIRPATRRRRWRRSARPTAPSTQADRPGQPERVPDHGDGARRREHQHAPTSRMTHAGWPGSPAATWSAPPSTAAPAGTAAAPPRAAAARRDARARSASGDRRRAAARSARPPGAAGQHLNPSTERREHQDLQRVRVLHVRPSVHTGRAHPRWPGGRITTRSTGLAIGGGVERHRAGGSDRDRWRRALPDLGSRSYRSGPIDPRTASSTPGALWLIDAVPRSTNSLLIVVVQRSWGTPGPGRQCARRSGVGAAFQPVSPA